MGQELDVIVLDHSFKCDSTDALRYGNLKQRISQENYINSVMRQIGWRNYLEMAKLWPKPQHLADLYLGVLQLSSPGGFNMAGDPVVSSPSTHWSIRENVKVLLVDDDAVCLQFVAGHLRKMKYHVHEAASASDALSLLRNYPDSVDIVVTDFHLPDMNGLELLKHVRREFQLPVVFLSADYRMDLIVESLMDGASLYLEKPNDIPQLENLWQFVYMSRKDKPISSKGTTEVHEGLVDGTHSTVTGVQLETSLTKMDNEKADGIESKMRPFGETSGVKSDENQDSDVPESPKICPPYPILESSCLN
ncbi:hypothetical protein Ancab_009264 [Ancistrocladus abbreviatus]